jgi:DNA helicase-2/ATP-dependent DNA helicase PcrA
MSAISISSDDLVDDLENHFRVFAGPGAGKTYWLIRQIEYVVQNSARLLPATRIACISYTNVAVRKIAQDLGLMTERVEVSTIHSFLYHNVVKPYLHVLRDQGGRSLVDYARVDGVDEHRPAFDKVKLWLQSVNPRNLRFFYDDCAATFEYLKKVVWQLDEATGDWNLKPIVPVRPVQYLPTSSLHSYKQGYWKEGIIDYDDVLYFSYRILDENPMIREFLSAKYPYIFIDEFQDTNPIQTQVVKWLAAEGTVVGVIGDLEQSIYKFQGARREDFERFRLPGHVDFTIRYNRRSTERIIALLNRLRTDDLEQNGHRKVEGEPVCVYVGEIEKVVPEIVKILPEGEKLVILARKNEEANRARRLVGTDISDLWERFENTDRYRRRFMEHLIVAGELAQNEDFTSAIKTLMDGIRVDRKPFRFSNNITEMERRGISVSLLEFLLSNYNELSDMSLLEAYQLTNGVLSEIMNGLKLTAVSKGRFKDFAESVKYKDLASTVSLTEDTRNVRTIHKAKAAEFDNVLVYFEDKEKRGEQLRYILQPEKRQSGDREEDRITYVACSRARERLFIAVPELSEEDEAGLRNWELEVIRV